MNVLLFLAVISASAWMVASSPVPGPASTTTVAPSAAPLPRIANPSGQHVVLKAPFNRIEGIRMSLARQGRHAEFQAMLASGQLQQRENDRVKSASPGPLNHPEQAEEENPRAERSVVVTAPLNDWWDGYWTGVVGMGNPAQYFNVTFDTGSANFWVMDSTCSVNCSGHALYYSKKSSAYSANGAPFNIGYGTGFANGFQGTDEWVLQGGSGSISLAIMGMPFGQATSVNSGGNTYISGILGLGWQALAVDNMLSPVMWAMSAGVFQQSLFTAYLATGGYASDGLAGGQVTFGALDTQNCGTVLGYAPLTAETYWQFNISDVGVGSNWYVTSASVAVSDTGTSTIAGPAATVAQIAGAVGAVWNSSMGAYAVGCNAQYSPVTFVINGVSYQLTYKALTINYSPTGTGKCVFGIVPSSVGMGIQWIVGDPFIRQFCTIYDVGNKRIGFAPANGMSSG